MELEVERFQHAEPLRPSIVDPYLPFVRQVLEQHPRLRATRIYQMIHDRGYSGSVEQLRRTVAPGSATFSSRWAPDLRGRIRGPRRCP